MYGCTADAHRQPSSRTSPDASLVVTVSPLPPLDRLTGRYVPRPSGVGYGPHRAAQAHRKPPLGRHPHRLNVGWSFAALSDPVAATGTPSVCSPSLVGHRVGQRARPGSRRDAHVTT